MPKAVWKRSLPKSWPAVVRSAMVHVVGLAKYAAVCTRSWAADSPNARVQLQAEREQLQQEVALLRAEIRIKDRRMKSLTPNAWPTPTTPCENTTCG